MHGSEAAKITDRNIKGSRIGFREGYIGYTSLFRYGAIGKHGVAKMRKANSHKKFFIFSS
jgi:hypothetical protein